MTCKVVPFSMIPCQHFLLLRGHVKGFIFCAIPQISTIYLIYWFLILTPHQRRKRPFCPNKFHTRPLIQDSARPLFHKTQTQNFFLRLLSQIFFSLSPLGSCIYFNPLSQQPGTSLHKAKPLSLPLLFATHGYLSTILIKTDS